MVARRFGQPSAGQPRRSYVTPLLATGELAFDTRHGPFADPRLRQAVSYALDRPALAAALGDLATDHYQPPGMPASPSGRSPADRPPSPGPRAGRPAQRTRDPGRLQRPGPPGC
jgi:ABC-type oligopeptide transport system substrate-binding subunit